MLSYRCFAARDICTCLLHEFFCHCMLLAIRLHIFYLSELNWLCLCLPLYVTEQVDHSVEILSLASWMHHSLWFVGKFCNLDIHSKTEAMDYGRCDNSIWLKNIVNCVKTYNWIFVNKVLFFDCELPREMFLDTLSHKVCDAGWFIFDKAVNNHICCWQLAPIFCSWTASLSGVLVSQQFLELGNSHRLQILCFLPALFPPPEYFPQVCVALTVALASDKNCSVPMKTFYASINASGFLPSILPSQHAHICPMWAPHGLLSGAHMGSPVRLDVNLVAGSISGSSRQPMN